MQLSCLNPERRYYDNFLRPCSLALHYVVPNAPKMKSFPESPSCKQYISVNQHFADKIVANYQEANY